ncbi:hypothetical protein HW555_003115, partial [Spodoptera exigua]
MKRSIVGGSLVYKQQPMFTDSVSSIYLSKVIKPQKKFVHHKKENLTVQGKNNAFMIELFAIREDIDDRHAYDLLEAAFELMKDLDYCIIRVPSADKTFPLLQHFCFVPTKPKVCCRYSLYIAHRSSVLGL